MTDDVDIGTRRDILRSLLMLDAPLAEVLEQVGHLPWDSERPLITLTPHHVVGVLRRFRRGDLNAREIEHWANAVEGRDDIGFSEGYDEVLRGVIFDLANPILQGALDERVADDMIARLLGRSEG